MGCETIGLTTSSTHRSLLPERLEEDDAPADPDLLDDPEDEAPEEPDEDPELVDQELLLPDADPLVLMMIVPLLMTVFFPLEFGICLEKSSASTVLTDVVFFVITMFFLAFWDLKLKVGMEVAISVFFGRGCLARAFSLVTFPIISVPPTPLS